MIRPKCWSTMCFWAARVIRNAPRRCTPRTVSQSSSDILKIKLSLSTPALLTRTAGGPSSATTLPTAASTWSAWLTSAPTANARPPADVIASTVGSQALASRSSTATASPSVARRRAVAAPIPRAAPVMMATRCASCGMSCFSFLGGIPGVAGVLAGRAAVRPQGGQREVLADAGRAVSLDRLVDHPLGHRRSADLDGLDLGVRALVAYGVHHPGGLEHGP